MSLIQKPLEIVQFDPSDTVGEQYDEHLKTLATNETSGFLVDARHLDFDPVDVNRAYSETDIVKGLVASVARSYRRGSMPERMFSGSSKKDFHYHRDSRSPTRTPAIRAHYTAKTARNVTFSNGLPDRYLTEAVAQGLSPDARFPEVEQSGVEHPGMFSVFAVDGGVIDSRSMLVPAKHLFATVHDAGEPFEAHWARRDVKFLPQPRT